MRFTLRSGFVTLLLFLALSGRAALAADEDAFLGTWVLNAAKSTVPAGAMPSSATVVLSRAGEGMFKSVSDTTLGAAAAHAEITFAIDGKDYAPVTTPAPPAGTPPIAQSFERVSAKAYKTSVKLAGQTVAVILNEVSADGKTLTLTTTGVGAAANLTATLLFDRK
jgi:hypothetical protein